MEYKNPSVMLPDVQKGNHQKKKSIGEKYDEIKSASFVFLDILGFKDTYKKGNTKSNVRNVFEYFNLLVSNMRFLQTDDSRCYAGQTSDSLYFYTDDLSYLTRFINVFLHFNVYAMSNNIFFRGGISTGDLFISRPYQFFGDCIINSYLLEENIAHFPRIAIDKSTRNKFKTVPENWEFEYEEKTDRYFLNPFSKAVVNDISDDLGTKDVELHNINLELIKDVQKNINSQKSTYEFNDNLYQKYSYLLNKCDNLINELEKE